MRAVIQRVSHASVTVDGEVTGAISRGLLLLLGAGHGDGEQEITYLIEKIINLRIFPDEQGKMNLSLLDVGGELLVVSQFTLYGDTRKGRRPSFVQAMAPEPAEQLYLRFLERVKDYGITPQAGIFGADMKVELLNDGPVTLILDTEKTS